MTPQDQRLLSDYVGDRLEPEDAARLNRLLREDGEAREWLITEAAFATRLGGLALASLSEEDEPAGETRRRRRKWAPLVTATAGLTVGVCCTSALFAFALPRSVNELTLLQESFERPAQRWEPGFPTRADEWAGDAGEVVLATPDVKPKDGRRMLRLDPSPALTLSYLERVIDLGSYPMPAEHQSRQVEVRVSFHAAMPGFRDRYTLRLAAFSRPPEEIKALWAGVSWKEMDSQTLASTKRALSTTSDARGWQTITAVVDAPREARCVVVSLASGLFETPDLKLPHYVDDVHVRMLYGPRPTLASSERR